MLNLTLNSWQVSVTQAKITWRIDDLYGDGIKRVEYNIRRANAQGTWLDTAGSTGHAIISVVNYTGKIRLDLRVTDFSDRVIEATSEVEVFNYVPPSAPDWLAYEEEVLGIVSFRWGASSPVSPTVASWRLQSTAPDGAVTILSERPVYEYQADVAIDPSKLHLVTVLGVDHEGYVSAPSPGLSFTRMTNGPRIALEPWQVNAREASIKWSIASSGLLEDIRWTVSDGTRTIADSALPIDRMKIDVKDFVGTLTFTLTAVDNQRRVSTTTSTIQVFNRAPGAASVRVDLVGTRFIRVQCIPPVSDLIPVDMLVLYGPTGPVELRAPFIHTFEDLTPRTEYRLSVKAVNRTGLSGPVSAVTTVKTANDPFAPKPTPEPQSGTSVVEILTPLLTGDVRAYLLQLYTDTRIRDPRMKQIVHPPAELDVVLDLYLPIASRFGDFLRKETFDQETYEASEVIDKTGDPLEKLAIFCERLEFGSIWNQG